MKVRVLKKKEIIVLKKIILSLIIFCPLYLVYIFFFGFNDFFNHYDIGKDIIYWQNIILTVSYILFYFSFIILWCIKRLRYIIIALIFVAIMGHISYSYMFVYYSTFTSDKWINNIESRHLMYTDFEKRYNLVGMHKEDVLELLGKDDKLKFEKNKGVLTYLVQDSSWLHSNSIDYLLIELDDNKLVISSKLLKYSEDH